MRRERERGKEKERKEGKPGEVRKGRKGEVSLERDRKSGRGEVERNSM